MFKKGDQVIVSDGNSYIITKTGTLGIVVSSDIETSFVQIIGYRGVNRDIEQYFNTKVFINNRHLKLMSRSFISISPKNKQKVV